MSRLDLHRAHVLEYYRHLAKQHLGAKWVLHPKYKHEAYKESAIERERRRLEEEEATMKGIKRIGKAKP